MNECKCSNVLSVTVTVSVEYWLLFLQWLVIAFVQNIKWLYYYGFNITINGKKSKKS
jgi:hypothetical protein